MTDGCIPSLNRRKDSINAWGIVSEIFFYVHLLFFDEMLKKP